MFFIFKKHPDIIAEISEISDGNMRISASNPKIIENRMKFLKNIGAKDINFISAGLIHGKTVKRVGKARTGKIIPETDGLITSDKNIFLTVTVADCLPVYFFDPQNLAVGMAHAGWKGLAENIIAETIKKFINEFGSDSNNILVGIGPGICREHYVVDEKRASKFQKYQKEAIIRKDGKIFLDLKKIAQIQLLEEGIEPNNIEIHPDCTFSVKEKYFSYRRDKPEDIEAMLAVIGIKTNNQ